MSESPPVREQAWQRVIDAGNELANAMAENQLGPTRHQEGLLHDWDIAVDALPQPDPEAHGYELLACEACKQDRWVPHKLGRFTCLGCVELLRERAERAEDESARYSGARELSEDECEILVGAFCDIYAESQFVDQAQADKLRDNLLKRGRIWIEMEKTQ